MSPRKNILKVFYKAKGVSGSISVLCGRLIQSLLILWAFFPSALMAHEATITETGKQDSLKAYCLKKLKIPSFENGNH